MELKQIDDIKHQLGTTNTPLPFFTGNMQATRDGREIPASSRNKTAACAAAELVGPFGAAAGDDRARLRGCHVMAGKRR